MPDETVLGISCYYHDAAACLVQDGEIVAAAEEERFSRDKHDNGFPEGAIAYCLEEAGIGPDEVDRTVFYEKPLWKFDRFVTEAARTFPRGFRFFSRVLPEWPSEKLTIRGRIREQGLTGDIEFVPHHRSHAASAYYPSPFDDAAILTVDGVGEWATNATFEASGDELTPLRQIEYPDSIGLLYSTITAFLGFMVNNDEYKVMGLAPYGEPRFREEFEELITLNDDGSYELDQEYFAYRYSDRMWAGPMEELLGPPRSGEEEDLTQRHRDIAATLQAVLEDVLLAQIDELYERTDSENLCMAGGVALNSAANGRIRREMPFDRLWIQPAAGDDGGALGAALDRSRQPSSVRMDDVFLGPRYDEGEIIEAVDTAGLSRTRLERDERIRTVVDRLTDGQVVALYQGRLEWGPRALGNRTIMADPRRAEMKDVVNNKIKFREEFRPFAPSVLEDRADAFFESFDGRDASPFMLFVHDVHEDRREDIPAVTHVNGTSRIQTVNRDQNAVYYDLIEAFGDETGVPVVLNTSFNLRGMPIVNRPEEAVDVLQRSGLDAVVMGEFLVEE